MEAVNFRDVIHLYLPFPANDDKGELFSVVGYSIEENNVQVETENYGGDWWNRASVNPILRTISNMSLPEMKELWLIIHKRHFHDSGIIKHFDEDKKARSIARFVMMSGVERVGIEMSGYIWADSDLQHIRYNNHEVTAFLLRKNFDLFGLIESGQAIDQNKL